MTASRSICPLALLLAALPASFVQAGAPSAPACEPIFAACRAAWHDLEPQVILSCPEDHAQALAHSLASRSAAEQPRARSCATRDYALLVGARHFVETSILAARLSEPECWPNAVDMQAVAQQVEQLEIEAEAALGTSGAGPDSPAARVRSALREALHDPLVAGYGVPLDAAAISAIRSEIAHLADAMNAISPGDGDESAQSDVELSRAVASTIAAICNIRAHEERIRRPDRFAREEAMRTTLEPLLSMLNEAESQWATIEVQALRDRESVLVAQPEPGPIALHDIELD